ncbi:MAG: hypothetical protein HZB53_05180 [Chloroflexi bacterium]|nr:hypothetical protein [Chloroflexota bacterium]
MHSLPRAARPALVLAVLTTLGLFFFLDHALRGPDYESYLAYARSMLYDGDILLVNDLELFGKAVFIAPTGYASVLANIGAAFFWLPFLALARLTHAAGAGLPLPLSGDGTSRYDSLWVNYGNWLYGLAALAVAVRWARRYVSLRAALLGALFAAVATPQFYYMTSYTPSTSMPSVFMGALLVAWWDGARHRDRAADWLLLGTLGGLSVAVGFYSAGFFAFPSVSLFVLALAGRVRRALALGLCVAAGALAGFTPQLAAWQIQFGALGNPYARQVGAADPAWWEPLFSTYHGALFYAPFLLVAAAGYFLLARRDRVLAVGGGLAFGLHWLAVALSLAWWAGASFGMRYFIGLTPLVVLGGARLFDGARARWVVVLAALCAGWTYLLFLGAYANGVSISDYYPLDAQWANVAGAARDLPRLLAAHWQPLKSPLVLPMLAPFGIGAFLACATGAWLVFAPQLRRPRAVVALALAPLLLTAWLGLAAGAGAAHLRELQAQSDYQSLPRGAGDPLDLSSTWAERGVYHLRNGDLAAADLDFRRAQEIVPDNAYVRLMASDAAFVPNRLNWQTASGLRLLGYGITPRVVSTRAPVYLSLYWQPAAGAVPPFNTRIAWLDAAGNVLASTDEKPTRGQWPFDRWTTGLLLRDQYALAAPDLPPGATGLTLRVRLIAAGGGRIAVTHDGAQVDGVLTVVSVEVR